jgi:hypothetical protein
MAAIITLRGWAELQHYKDRDPPWVKLHRKLLTSESWVLGTDISRLVQVASMMLAPRYENRIPYDWSLLKKVSHLDCTEEQFKASVLHLVRYKFIEIQEVTGELDELVQSASNVLAKCSSEERREETEKRQRRTPHTPQGGVAQERDLGSVGRVFAHWKSEYSHPRAVLDTKRRKVIEQALTSYDETTLCAAIAGYKHSPHHMGQNERQTVYDDIGLFLRDATHIDAGLQFARGPPKQLSPVERVRQRLAARNGNGDERVVSEQFGAESGSSLAAVGGLLRRIPNS